MIKKTIDHILLLTNLVLIITTVNISTSTDKNTINTWGWISIILGVMIYSVSIIKLIFENKNKKIIEKEAKKEFQMLFWRYIYELHSIFSDYTTGTSISKLDKTPFFKRHENKIQLNGYDGKESYYKDPDYYFNILMQDPDAWIIIKEEYIDFHQTTDSILAKNLAKSSEHFKTDFPIALNKYKGFYNEIILKTFNDLTTCMFYYRLEFLEGDIYRSNKISVDEKGIIWKWLFEFHKRDNISNNELKDYGQKLTKFVKSIL